jgi:hypothetical protein
MMPFAWSSHCRKGDMRFNAKFAELVDVRALVGFPSDELVTGERRTLEGGWVRDADAAWAMRELLAIYHGYGELLELQLRPQRAAKGRDGTWPPRLKRDMS